MAEDKTHEDKTELVCPLRMINARDQRFNPETIQGTLYCKCLKEKCAWWMHAATSLSGLYFPSGCAISRMARER